jgi:hypothetical protein
MRLRLGVADAVFDEIAIAKWPRRVLLKVTLAR